LGEWETIGRIFLFQRWWEVLAWGYFAAAQAQAVKSAAESWAMEQAYCGHTNWMMEEMSPGKKLRR
jgi:hypothetical protein